MKTLIFFLSCVTCVAQWNFQDVTVQNWGTAPAPLPTPNIVHEDFDAGTIPTGWFDGGANVWNYTPALMGTYSLALSAATAQYIWENASNEVYVTFMFSFQTNTTQRSLSTLRNTNGPVVAAYLYQTADNKLQIYDTGFAHNKTTTATMSSNTTYYVWFHYLAGAGTDAQISAAFSTTAVEPTSGNAYTNFTNGGSTVGVNSWTFNAPSSSAGTNIIDHAGAASFAMTNTW